MKRGRHKIRYVIRRPFKMSADDHTSQHSFAGCCYFGFHQVGIVEVGYDLFEQHEICSLPT